MVVIWASEVRNRHRPVPAEVRHDRTETLLRRQAGGAGTSTPLDPFDDDAMVATREWMQAQIDVGRDPADLRAEIAERLWTWAQRVADRAIGRLPRHADAAEVRSRVATALWQCCGRLDPDQTRAWSVWLHIRVRGAVLDAARAADRLSRHDRRMVTDGTATDAVVRAALPAVSLDEADGLPDPGRDPGRAVVDSAVVDAVREWVQADLPPDVADRLCRWWRTTGATTSLPACLAAEVQPYVFRLLPAAALLD